MAEIVPNCNYILYIELMLKYKEAENCLPCVYNYMSICKILDMKMPIPQSILWDQCLRPSNCWDSIGYAPLTEQSNLIKNSESLTPLLCKTCLITNLMHNIYKTVLINHDNVGIPRRLYCALIDCLYPLLYYVRDVQIPSWMYM